MAEALAEIGRRCRRERLRPPSRATVYKLLDTLPTSSYRFRELPPPVQEALYNLGPGGEVPGHQVAFYCFNYGDLAAVSYASGLPWLAIHQAVNLPGWRARSRGLAEAVARDRGLRVPTRSVDGIKPQRNGTEFEGSALGPPTPIVEDQRLNVTGLLGTKLHAILDRGTRRDFFDLYTTLQTNGLGIAECLSAIRRVFRQEVNDALLLRALTWFQDAEREAPLPGEGPKDWETVKDFFRARVGHLLIPPGRVLQIQARVVDVADAGPATARARPAPGRSRNRSPSRGRSRAR